MSKNRHVTHRSNGLWANQRAGSSRASSLHKTQREAQAAARKQLQRAGQGGELITHGKNGRIRQKNTINVPDPHPPKG